MVTINRATAVIGTAALEEIKSSRRMSLHGRERHFDWAAEPRRHLPVDVPGRTGTFDPTRSAGLPISSRSNWEKRSIEPPH